MANTVKYVVFSTKWGHFGLAGTDRMLLRTQLPWHNKRALENRLLDGLGDCRADRGYLNSLQKLIEAYFEGQAVEFGADIPVELGRFKEFGRRVLDACRGIKYAGVMTYGELAHSVGSDGAGRAVGNVLAANPVPLIIPCHRVLCGNGGLGGFSAPGGCDLKARMLEIEESAR